MDGEDVNTLAGYLQMAILLCRVDFARISFYLTFWGTSFILNDGWEKFWSRRGYRDSARLLGESCTKTIEGQSGGKIAQKSRNSCKMNGQGCCS